MNISSPAVRKIDMMGGAVVVAMTALAFFAGLRPLMNARIERRQTIGTLSQAQHERARLEASETDLQKEMQDIATELERSEITLLGADQLNSRLRKLTEVAERHDLRVEVRQPGQPTYLSDAAGRAPRFGVVPITLQGRGTYDAFGLFLRQLNGEFRDTGVRMLEISGDGEGSEPQWSTELTWYVLPQDRR